MSEYCICCGDEIPEGRHVCPNCIRMSEVSLDVDSGQDTEVRLCRRCGRRLKTDEAKKRGYGRVCWEKSRPSDRRKPLFLTCIGDTENGDT